MLADEPTVFSRLWLGMCYQVVELYSACRCLYYQHTVDRCPSYGRPGHYVTKRTILVGYACAAHSQQSYGDNHANTRTNVNTPRPTLKKAVKEIRKSEQARTRAEGSLADNYSDGSPSNNPYLRTGTRPKSGNSGDSRQIKQEFAKTQANEPQERSRTPLQETSTKAKQSVDASDSYIEVLVDDGSSVLSSLFDEQGMSSETSISTPESLNAVEFLLGGLLYDEILQYLWPQLFLRASSVEQASQLITRFLLRYSLDLQTLAQNLGSARTPDKFADLKLRAGQFVEKRRRTVAREICKTFRLPDSHSEAPGQQAPEVTEISLSSTTPEDDDQGGSDQPELERLDILKDFVFNTDPFFCFRQNVRVLLEEPLYLHLNIRIADRARNIFNDVANSVCGPTTGPGTGEQRVYYTCKCGFTLCDDYIERRPGALEDLKHFLSASGIRVGASIADLESNTIATSTPGGRTLPIANPGTLQTKTTADRGRSRLRLPFDIRLPRYWQTQNNSLELGKCGQERTATAPAPPKNHNYLLLCVPFGNLIYKLQQPEVCTVDSDQDFFSLLRVLYHKSRTKLSLMPALKRVKSIHFVQFEMYRRDLTDVRSQPALPPPETLKTDYLYDPMPADLMPPVGSNLLVHFFEHPTHAGALPDLYRRIPKKLREKLSPCPVKGSSVGWGIAFAEGVDAFTFFLCGCAGFIVCLMVSIAWTVAQSDIQGGFGIGAFLLAFMIFCGGLVYSSATTKLHI
ncbi:hypothetical protein PGQ11_001042 [Apiospora arundinis]|uniref:Uncharacterized protein n=1 Tax=Apiospora arundinis TaxID=335852 RepID=A0ABR2JM59_9PEZI